MKNFAYLSIYSLSSVIFWQSIGYGATLLKQELKEQVEQTQYLSCKISPEDSADRFLILKLNLRFTKCSPLSTTGSCYPFNLKLESSIFDLATKTQTDFQSVTPQSLPNTPFGSGSRFPSIELWCKGNYALLKYYYFPQPGQGVPTSTQQTSLSPELKGKMKYSYSFYKFDLFDIKNLASEKFESLSKAVPQVIPLAEEVQSYSFFTDPNFSQSTVLFSDASLNLGILSLVEDYNEYTDCCSRFYDVGRRLGRIDFLKGSLKKIDTLYEKKFDRPLPSGLYRSYNSVWSAIDGSNDEYKLNFFNGDSTTPFFTSIDFSKELGVTRDLGHVDFNAKKKILGKYKHTLDLYHANESVPFSSFTRSELYSYIKDELSENDPKAHHQLISDFKLDPDGESFYLYYADSVGTYSASTSYVGKAVKVDISSHKVLKTYSFPECQANERRNLRLVQNPYSIQAIGKSSLIVSSGECINILN